jgi:hypothetical protein
VLVPQPLDEQPDAEGEGLGVAGGEPLRVGRDRAQAVVLQPLLLVAARVLVSASKPRSKARRRRVSGVDAPRPSAKVLDTTSAPSR